MKVPKIGTMFEGRGVSTHGNHHVYTVCKAEEFHTIYKYSFTIKHKDFVICHVHMCPRSSALDIKGCAVKAGNRLLYSCSWSQYLHDVIDALGLKVVSLTRVDVCCDFVKFANDLLPSDFIHHYLRDTCDEFPTTYIRRGSNKYCCIGVKRMLSQDEKINKDSLIDAVESSFDYIRWGSRSSGCSVYLYNKWQELKDKKSKPWILQSWIDAGIIEDPEKAGDPEHPVYRLELSIQAKGMNVKDVDRKAADTPAIPKGKGKKKKEERLFSANDYRKLSVDDFATQTRVEQTFWSYADRYFSFKICEGQKYVKDMKTLVLFDEMNLEPTLKPIYFNTSLNAGRAEHNASVAIRRVYNELGLLSTSEKDILYQAHNILQKIAWTKCCDAKNLFGLEFTETQRKEVYEHREKEWDRHIHEGWWNDFLQDELETLYSVLDEEVSIQQEGVEKAVLQNLYIDTNDESIFLY